MDVTRPGSRGKTPMDVACQRGHLNIVQHLIHHHRIPLDRRVQIAEPSPEFLRVHGAGNSMVDGIYTLAGTHKNVDKWYVVLILFVVAYLLLRSL